MKRLWFASAPNRQPDAFEARIWRAARRGAKRAVLAGKGFEHGVRTSVGAAKRGRVWSSQRLGVDSFAKWARGIGAKIVDEAIDPDTVLAGTLKPVAVGVVPAKVVIAVEWPIEIIRQAEQMTHFSATGVHEESSTNVDIEVAPRADDGPFVVRVYCDRWESFIRLELFAMDEGFDFRFVHSDGRRLNVRRGQTTVPLADYFAEFPPVFWFADGSSLDGCEYTELPSDGLSAYPTDKLQVVDWTDVNIRAESQGEQRTPGTIQHKVIATLQQDTTYTIIFDDDGSNEAADIVAVKVVEQDQRMEIEVELYHLKYALGAPGGRIDDLYVVCGQAQRSTGWLETHDRRTELFNHLLKRNATRVDSGRSTRFERGNVEALRHIREMSRRVEVKLKVFVVQPGLSKADATARQMTLLAVTERYLSDTYEVPLVVMCSA